MKKVDIFIKIKNYLLTILFLLFFIGMIGIVDLTGHKVGLLGAFFIASLMSGLHYALWSDEVYEAFEESKGKTSNIDYQTRHQRYENYQKLAIFELIFMILLFGLPIFFPIIYEHHIIYTLTITIIIYIIIIQIAKIKEE